MSLLCARNCGSLCYFGDITLPGKKSENAAFYIQIQLLIRELQQEEQDLDILEVS